MIHCMDDPREIEFEKPKGAEIRAEGAEIHVMPEKFRGVTVEAKIPQVSAPRPGLRGEIEAEKPKKEARPKPPAVPGEGPKKKFPWFLIILILVIVAALVVSILFVLQGVRQETPQAAVEEPAAPPPPPPVVEPEEEEIPMATEEVSLPATVEETIPVEPEEEEVIATPEVSVPIAPPQVTGGVDADSDGLTDVEEVLYGTDAARPDTDLDGYLDGNEVYHLYNPGGTAPVTLVESGVVKSHINDILGYEIYYPTKWVLGPTADPDMIFFTAGSGEFVQVLVQDNPQGLSLKDWYLAQAPGVDEGDVKSFQNKAGLEGLQSPDRLTAYFQKDSKIFAVSLNLETKTVIQFRRTYEMMLNSFKFAQ